VELVPVIDVVGPVVVTSVVASVVVASVVTAPVVVASAVVEVAVAELVVLDDDVTSDALASTSDALASVVEVVVRPPADPLVPSISSGPHPARQRPVTNACATSRRDTDRVLRDNVSPARIRAIVAMVSRESREESSPSIRCGAVLYYVSSDLLTQVSHIVNERGLSLREVVKRMGSCGRSFERQLRRSDPNPSSDALFSCLRALELELSGCRRVYQYIRRLNRARNDAALSFRQVAEISIPRSNHRTVALALSGRRIPRMHSLLSLTCALDVHPVIAPSSSLAPRRVLATEGRDAATPVARD